MKSRIFAALALLASLCVFASPSRAQSVEPPPDGSFPIPHVGPLTGGCQYFWTGVDVTTGNFYTCSGSLPNIGPNPGTWTLVNSTGTIGSGTVGNPVVYSTTSGVTSSNQTVDISVLSGANWGAKLATCSALGSVTCVVPDSEAPDGTETSVTLGSNVNLKFTGSGTFNACTINLGINSHVDLGAATLKAATSSCTLLKQTTFVSEQTATKLRIEGGILDCNSQTGATGINLGNVTQAELNSIGFQNCTDTSTSTVSAPTGGLVLQGSQFDKFTNLKFYNVAYPVKCYSDPTGGGCNSNSFYDLNIATGCQVGTIFANRSSMTNLQIGPNVFQNPTVQNCAVSGQAQLGNTNVCSGTSCQSTMTIISGAPEVNGTANVTATFTNSSAVISGTNSYTVGQVVEFNTTGTLPTNFATNTPYYVISTGLSGSQFEVSATSGGSAITAGSAGSGTQTALLCAVVDGFTIRQSSVFLSDAILTWIAPGIEEASVTPIVDLEAYSTVITWNSGAGAGQTFSSSADGTGQTSIQGLTFSLGTSVNQGTWLNYQPATSGANKSSPVVSLCGNLWTGSASAQDCMGIQNLFVGGSNPATVFKFSHPTAGGSGVANANFQGFSELDPPSGFITGSAWNVGSSSFTVTSGITTLGGAVNASAGINEIDNAGKGSSQGGSANACETSFGATTVNTGSATTTTGLSCIPANAYIDAVVYRVTTAITTAASFTVGISGSTSKFCSTQSTLTLGATGTCNAQINAGTPVNGASTVPVVVTFNATPGAGAMRIIVYYHTWTPPTS